ncbi:MAG: hypothetical protein KF708_19370 [Pirellulales bacterium]|nr:hypothetical protein [Pirellulales bacterium]
MRSTGLGSFFWRLAAPAWLISIVVHVGLLVTLGFIGAGGSLGLGQGGGEVLEVSFELSDDDATGESAQEEVFFEGSDEPVTLATSIPAPAATTDTSFLDDAPPVDPTGVLPAMNAPVGAADTGLSSGPVGQAKGSGAPRGNVGDGSARTGIFGAEGEGFKFVYVFDRSGSMGGSGRSALNAAKAELLASLEDLGELHQFQIIFYNQEPTIFPLAGQEGRLVFANQANKLRAERFIQQITADGATAHEDALKAALALRPDVIFFLTDADEPSLSPTQMKRIEKLNGGRTVIHVVEFGMGPYLGIENFLVRLARENRGEHAYVDISKLGPVH